MQTVVSDEPKSAASHVNQLVAMGDDVKLRAQSPASVCGN
jgi:hypothetical protein